MTEEEITEKINDEATPLMEKLVAKIAKKALQTSDHSRFDFLLNRSKVGKATEKHELTGKDGGPIETKSELKTSIEERIKQVKGEA
jgi:hypothetical protein